MKALLVALAFVASPVLASDWTDADTVREGAFVSVLTLDYAQTRGIKNYTGAYEENPMMGRHPSDARVRNYFLGAAATHILVARQLPAGWPRQTFQYGWFIAEAVQVVKNKRAGFAFQF